MSAAGSLAGRKRDRPAQSPGPRGLSGHKSAAKALERLAAAHSACSQIVASQAYPEALSELARALRHIFEATVVVVRDGASGITAAAPSIAEPQPWLDALHRRHIEGREVAPFCFDVEARDPAPIVGVRRFVVIPIGDGRGHSELWLGFGDHGPSSAEELTSFATLGEHLSLALRLARPPVPFAADPSSGTIATPPLAPTPSQTADELISLAAHELRTPLTPIAMLLQSLERKARAGTADIDIIMRTRKQVNRLTNMISDLLDLSRLREGRLTLTPTPVDLVRAVRDAIDAYQQVDAKHRIELRGEPKALEVMTDESRLHQGVMSLIDHVAHATPAGGTVEVTLQKREGSAALTIRADRTVFGMDALHSSDTPHARPEPIALGVLLAEVVTARLGGAVSLRPQRSSETRAEMTLPLSTVG